MPSVNDALTLADAINADRMRRGETVEQWAKREGVPAGTVKRWLLNPPDGHMARLLAARL